MNTDWRDCLVTGLVVFAFVFAMWENAKLNQWEHFGWRILRSDDCAKYQDWQTEAAKLLGGGYRP